MIKFSQWILENDGNVGGGQFFWGDTSQGKIVAAGVFPIAADTGKICLLHRSNEINNWIDGKSVDMSFGGKDSHPGVEHFKDKEFKKMYMQGCYGTFGGGLNKMQPEQAAKKETQEETGYPGPWLKFEKSYAWPIPGKSIFYQNFIGVIPKQDALQFHPEPSYGPTESYGIKWVDWEEIQGKNGLNGIRFHDGLTDFLIHAGPEISRIIEEIQSKINKDNLTPPRNIAPPMSPMGKNSPPQISPPPPPEKMEGFQSWLGRHGLFFLKENIQELNDIVQKGFVFLGDASGLGGAGDKHYLKSKANGEKYLFKPGAKGSEDRPQQPHADVLGSTMASKLLGPKSYVPVGYISPQNFERLITPQGNDPSYSRFVQRYGRVGGSVQPIIANAISKDYRHGKHTEFSPEDIRKIQQEQIVDWLISNHDSHGAQFIRNDLKELLGIDKSQAMKYFGSDDLSPDYSPNSVYGEDDPVYNHLFRSAKNGEIQIDPMVIKPLLDKVDQISDEEYIEMFTPFLNSLVGHPQAEKAMKGLNKRKFGQEDVNEVARMVLDRKHKAKEMFSNYYSKMLGKNIRF